MEDWRVVTPSTVIAENEDDCVLALRLGAATNAIRAAQRFYLASEGSPGPAGERDRFWSFLIAAAFVGTALKMVDREASLHMRVWELARRGGASDETLALVDSVIDGRHSLSDTIMRMRDKFAFHWDPSPMKKWLQARGKAEIVWAEGRGDSNGEMIYRASADAIANQINPPEPDETDEESRARAQEAINKFTPIMAAVLEVFESALATFLGDAGATQEEVDP